MGQLQEARSTSPSLIDEVADLLRVAKVPDSVSKAILALVVHHADPGIASVPVARAGAPLPDLHAVAKQFHKHSLRRTEVFGLGLVSDVAWNMMLALAAEEDSGEAPTISSLCYASGGPQTTALRYVHTLEDEQLINLSPDGRDGRLRRVAMTNKGRDRTIDLIKSFIVAPPTMG